MLTFGLNWTELSFEPGNLCVLVTSVVWSVAW